MERNSEENNKRESHPDEGKCGNEEAIGKTGEPANGEKSMNGTTHKEKNNLDLENSQKTEGNGQNGERECKNGVAHFKEGQDEPNEAQENHKGEAKKKENNKQKGENDQKGKENSRKMGKVTEEKPGKHQNGEKDKPEQGIIEELKEQGPVPPPFPSSNGSNKSGDAPAIKKNGKPVKNAWVRYTETKDLSFLKEYEEQTITSHGKRFKKWTTKEGNPEVQIDESTQSFLVFIEERLDSGLLLNKEKVGTSRLPLSYRIRSPNLPIYLKAILSTMREKEVAWFELLPSSSAKEETVLTHEYNSITAAIFIEVEVIEMRKKTQELNVTEPEKKLKFLLEQKQLGNNALANQEFLPAFTHYKSVIHSYQNLPRVTKFSKSKEILEKMETIYLETCNNAAMVALKLNKLNSALKFANIVLSKDENNLKALYRKVRALMSLNQVPEAVKVYKHYIQIGGDPEFLSDFAKEIKRAGEFEKKVYSYVMSEYLCPGSGSSLLGARQQAGDDIWGDSVHMIEDFEEGQWGNENEEEKKAERPPEETNKE